MNTNTVVCVRINSYGTSTETNEILYIANRQANRFEISKNFHVYEYMASILPGINLKLVLYVLYTCIFSAYVLPTSTVPVPYLYLGTSTVQVPVPVPAQ